MDPFHGMHNYRGGGSQGGRLLWEFSWGQLYLEATHVHIERDIVTMEKEGMIQEEVKLERGGILSPF